MASLAPPSSLEYIAEQRIVKGQRSLHFDCDLFTELYVEYCFVYVSQAITGAVADVRIDCVPTLPVSGKEATFSFLEIKFIVKLLLMKVRKYGLFLLKFKLMFSQNSQLHLQIQFLT